MNNSDLIQNKTQVRFLSINYYYCLFQKMEKFKIVERETKTKAYSKEGLTSGQKLDPAERERADISQWLNSCLEQLNIQIDSLEAEIECLGTTKKKKGRPADPECFLL